MTFMSVFSSLLLFILSLSIHPSFASEDELRSLLEFKKGIKNDPLNKIFSSWNFSAADPIPCPSAFYGVWCDPTSNSVVAIVLDHLGLSGELKFSTLTGLKQLQNLSLAGNAFTGRLVPALGLITSLQHLDLSDNQFYGPIPARLNDLWGLNYLNLSKNNYTGGYPSGSSNLQQLKVLDLHSNGLWGDITEIISQLRNVEHLDLSGNGFFGSLSDMSEENVSSLANTLQFINLNHNRLGGELLGSEAIVQFRNLRVFDLGHNKFNGELPSFGNFSNLQVLKLGNNVFSGEIPVEFFESLVSLQELDLSGNGFSGSIPSINSTSLKTLNLSSNALSGRLPVSVGNCLIIDLSRNTFSDDISVLENWGMSLEIIELSSNELTGIIPNESHFQQLTSLNLGNNSLVGDIPKSLGTYPRLVSLDLSSNELNGSIPASLFTSVALTKLNLSGNHLTGEIPFKGSQSSGLLVLPSFSPMESLDLSSNLLKGGISSGISSMGKLQLLNLSKNQLTGDLPKELTKLTVLEDLDLSFNHFTGEIPDGLSPMLRFLNLSDNKFMGKIPVNLQKFPDSSFENNEFRRKSSGNRGVTDGIQGGGGNHSKSKTIIIAIVVASVGAVIMVAFLFIAYYRSRAQLFRGQTTQRGIKPDLFRQPVDPTPASTSFSDANTRSLSGAVASCSEIVEAAAGSESEQRSSLGSPIRSSPRFLDADVYSPDRFVGELVLLNSSLHFTAEELSRAPAEVIGRSCHGTLYKATLDRGHMLIVKWLRAGSVKLKKEFSKEAKKIGSVKHPNILSPRAYYWGAREQERIIIADYIDGDSLALHLYESTPRRYALLTFIQRFKVAVDLARCLVILHDKGMAHGNLKPTNILLVGSDHNVHVTDYGLHRLLTPAGIVESLLNLGALGYCAPELASADKPVPSLKSDVYAFGVIVMELLTRRSAGDIISGQSGAVDLIDWVQLWVRDGRGRDIMDRDISSGEEYSRAMEELLTVSLKCILPVNERPSMRQVSEELHSISV